MIVTLYIYGLNTQRIMCVSVRVCIYVGVYEYHEKHDNEQSNVVLLD